MSTKGLESYDYICDGFFAYIHAMLHELYLNIFRQVYDDNLENRELVDFRNCRVRAQFIEADDGEVAVELMAQAMNGAHCSFDFVLMDNIMVRTN